MRKEPFGVANYVHVYNRGNRKQPIVHTIADKERFLRTLYYFNSEEAPINLFHDLHKQNLLRSDLHKMVWLDNWQPRKPIVSIISFILMENHFLH